MCDEVKLIQSPFRDISQRNSFLKKSSSSYFELDILCHFCGCMEDAILDESLLVMWKEILI